jgi:hypothetical protein
MRAAAVAVARRADRDEQDVDARGHRLVDVRGEAQEASAGIDADQIGEPGLVDGNRSVLEPPDLCRVAVDADDVVAELRQAGAGHQANIARPDHCHIQHHEGSGRFDRPARCQ